MFSQPLVRKDPYNLQLNSLPIINKQTVESTAQAKVSDSSIINTSSKYILSENLIIQIFIYATLVKIKIQLLPIKMHPLFPTQDARRQGTMLDKHCDRILLCKLLRYANLL
jgi:hypothetical protein